MIFLPTPFPFCSHGVGSLGFIVWLYQFICLFFLFVATVWGTWSSWSGCTSSCGGGRRSRVRSCLNGNTCYGPTHEYENCNELSCPDRKFKNWFMKHSLIYNFIYLLFLYFGLLLFLSLSPFIPPFLSPSLTYNSSHVE